MTTFDCQTQVNLMIFNLWMCIWNMIPFKVVLPIYFLCTRDVSKIVNHLGNAYVYSISLEGSYLLLIYSKKKGNTFAPLIYNKAPHLNDFITSIRPSIHLSDF